MKTPLQTKSTPAWQIERSKIIQRACLRITSAVQSGKQVSRAIRQASRYYSGRQCKSNPSRLIRLSPGSLRRYWDAWKRGGKSPAAFALHFKPRRKNVPASTMIDFIGYCSGDSHRSLASALRRFNSTRRRPLTISDFLLRRYFPTAEFYRLKLSFEFALAAQRNLARQRMQLINEFYRRLSDAGINRKNHSKRS